VKDMELNELIDEEINFHSDVEEPLLFVWVCHLFKRKTPKEAVLKELTFLKLCGELWVKQPD
jgi:hypothetical protein